MTKSVLLLLCALGLFAQDRATLTGIVKDPSGATVPKATVKVTNISNNESFVARYVGYLHGCVWNCGSTWILHNPGQRGSVLREKT